VDAITEHDAGRRLVAVKNVTVNEEFFQGHFPGAPLMPGDPPTTSTPPLSYFDPVGERAGTSERSTGSKRRARASPISWPTPAASWAAALA